MKIRIELEALHIALDMIAKLAPPTSGHITFVSDGKRLRVLSSSDLSRLTSTLPCEVEGEGEFAIPLQAIKDATKGRKELTLDYKNAMLLVASGRYKANLATVDVIPADEFPNEESKDWKLGPEEAAWLKKSLREVGLRPTALLSSWMPVGISLAKGRGFVACYDTQHMSWATTKIAGDFECVMPIDTMAAIVDVFGKHAFTIRQMRNRIEVKTKLTSVTMNLPTMDDLPSLADVKSKVASASKIDGSTLIFNKSDITSFMDNAKAVIGKERAELLVEAADGKLKATIKTDQGEVATVIRGKGEGKFKIDYEYFLEGIGKADEQVHLNVVADAFLSLKLKGTSIIIALNQ